MERVSGEKSADGDIALGRAKVHLVCGYSRTGKDTLFQILFCGGKIEDYTGTREEMKEKESRLSFRKWLVYSAPTTTKPDFGDRSKLKRIAFADALKEEAFLCLNLEGKYQDYEDMKDKKLVYPQHDPMSEPVPKLLRQHYIDHGTMRRKQDIDYWCKKALEKHRGKEDHVMVTDFRFTNEAAFSFKHFTTDTTRVFNSEVKVAPKDVVSEHELD